VHPIKKARDRRKRKNPGQNWTHNQLGEGEKWGERIKENNSIVQENGRRETKVVCAGANFNPTGK